MKRTLLAGLVLLSLPAASRADVAVLYWTGVKVPEESRRQIELIAKDVAEQYASANEYTKEMGPIDFLHGENDMRVHIWGQEPDQPVFYWYGDIFCHENVTLDLADFRQKLMHEFSHAYDYLTVDLARKKRRKDDPILHYRIRKRRVKDPLSKYVADNDANEARARRKETLYMGGPGRLRPVPCPLHPKPNGCVESFKFDMDAKALRKDPALRNILDAAAELGVVIVGEEPAGTDDHPAIPDWLRDIGP